MSTTTSTFTPRLDGAPLDPSERRAPRGSGLNARVMGLELRRVLRNRRSLIFTLIFPIAMFFFVASSISEGDQVIGNGVVANVNAYLMVNMALYGAIMAATSAGALWRPCVSTAWRSVSKTIGRSRNGRCSRASRRGADLRHRSEQ